MTVPIEPGSSISTTGGISALEIIRDEHRAIAAVLDALGYIVRTIESDRLNPDHVLLASLIEYIAEMPDKLHHPKEDLIFALLRSQTHDLDEHLDRLERDHRDAVPATSTLYRALVHYLRAGEAGFPPFRDAVQSYIRYELRHLQTEERHIFPAARRRFNASDWREINAAFERNADPWRGLDDHFVHLFHQITSMAPPPIGFGEDDWKTTTRGR